MEFRLTYDGELLGASRKNTRAAHKHTIRRHFNPQLKCLWEQRPHLNIEVDGIDLEKRFESALDQGTFDNRPILEVYPEKFVRGKYRFMPLVLSSDKVRCGLELLFLRPEKPGKIISGGDIDNRLKTLFDALRVPSEQELPDERDQCVLESPFHCLLEDDSLIDHVSVETDTLLSVPSDAKRETYVRLVIRVNLRGSLAEAPSFRFA